MSQIVLAVRDPVSATTRAFDQDEILVGRAEESDIVLADRAASRRHARLLRDGGGWWIEDLGSRAGTRRNSNAVTVREALAPGDQIGVGTSRWWSNGSPTAARRARSRSRPAGRRPARRFS